MATVKEISEGVQAGRTKLVKELVSNALSEGISARDILNEGLLKGMMVIGDKFKNNEIFMPEVLVTARAMNGGLAVLEPLLVEAGNEPLGKVVIGTVKGDMHDIGKNLVAMMLKGAGFEVTDIGVDASAEQFITAAEEQNADIICISALLTTTMPYITTIINEINNRKLREKYIIMIGGAPVNEEFAKKAGADYYTKDAPGCAEIAAKAVKNRSK